MSEDVITIKVRGYHLDAYGHVHHARYLEFLEEGRWALFEKYVDLEAWDSRGHGFFVVHLGIDYRSSAKIGDRLAIETRLSRIGKKSMTLLQCIMQQSDRSLVAEAEVIACIADRKSQRALPLVGDIRSSLERIHT